MKRVTLFLISVFVFSLISILTLQVWAEQVSVKLEPEYMEVSPGREFKISVIIDPGTYGVSAGDIKIVFDPTVLEALNISAGSIFGSPLLEPIRDINNTKGRIHYVAARIGKTIPPTPLDDFLSIRFRVKTAANPGDYIIKIESIGLSDENASDIPDILTRDSVIRILTTATQSRETSMTYITTTTFYTIIYTPTRTITIIAEGKADLVSAISIFIIMISLVIIGVLLFTIIRKRRRKPIVIAVR